MSELINAITSCIVKLSDKANNLTPLLQTVAVIVGMVVIGLMVWKGNR
ncbi:hypothetical protein [Paraburkholderia haematera]|jgi:hypothetical protein|uniref:Uncharacterized protein n=1 Tax=Paraburkholderia haematera TaxID=2793077 RepID=A0ABN7MSJ0_9BURK|nr:hypothetical protein [Paraburkholderia haematera]CAE6826913.1 hypothetical protein R69888_06382 [Paraburkholderia haematera]